MSVKLIDENTINIYLKKENIENVNLKDKLELEKYLKSLFKKLNEYYNLKIEGYYDIDIYIDKFYGVIMHMEKEEFDYYDYYSNQIDMRIVCHDSTFLYKVNDIPDYYDKFNVKIKNNNIYLEIKDKLTNKEMMNLIENTEEIILNKNF